MPIEIKTIVRGDRKRVEMDLLQRLLQVELSLFHTLNAVLRWAIGNPPSVLDSFLRDQLERYRAVAEGRDPALHRTRWSP